MGTKTFDEVCEVAPQISRVGRLQPDLLAAVGPPDLEIGHRAFHWPVSALFRKQRDVDEASDAEADVHEDPDRTGPRNLHDGALEDLPEGQTLPNPSPLGSCHHARIIALSSGSSVTGLGRQSPVAGAIAGPSGRPALPSLLGFRLKFCDP